VRAGEPGCRRQVVDAERFEVAGVGQILGTEEVALGRDEGDAASMARAAPAPSERLRKFNSQTRGIKGATRSGQVSSTLPRGVRRRGGVSCHGSKRQIPERG
jgi:hypothetical protein